MGLFTGFFSPKVPEQQAGRRDVAILMGIGNFDLEIVGEAHYQAALEAICGPRVPKGVNRFETAWLILEDKNAVRIDIRGRQVGDLSPEVAIRYRQQLIARNMPRANSQCQAVITGGWLSSDGRKGLYEVRLDFPTLYQ